MSQLGERHQVVVVSVDAARSHQAQEVQPAAPLHRVARGGQQDRVGEEAAVVDGVADARQILHNGEAGTQVEVPDLAVAHLALWQADGRTGGSQLAVRPGEGEPIPGRQPRSQQRIARGVVGEAPAIEHAEDHGPGSIPRYGHARASAAMRTMAAKRAASSDAPPTSAPSMSGWVKNSAAFSGVQLPPYRTGTSSAPGRSLSARMARTCTAASCASSPEAASPVPMAHTGS